MIESKQFSMCLVVIFLKNYLFSIFSHFSELSLSNEPYLKSHLKVESFSFRIVSSFLSTAAHSCRIDSVLSDIVTLIFDVYHQFYLFTPEQRVEYCQKISYLQWFGISKAVSVYLSVHRGIYMQCRLSCMHSTQLVQWVVTNDIIGDIPNIREQQ